MNKTSEQFSLNFKITFLKISLENSFGILLAQKGLYDHA